MRILPVMLELGEEILILGRRPLEIPLFNHRAPLSTDNGVCYHKSESNPGGLR